MGNVISLLKENGVKREDYFKLSAKSRRLSVLNEIMEESFRNPEESLKLVDEINELFKSFGARDNKNYLFLELVLKETLFRNYHEATHILEKDVYEWFKSNYKEKLGEDYSIVNKKNKAKHQADFWVEKDNEQIPVEVKLYGFDEKALQQLQRYMRVYNCQKGIAVGSGLHCNLPENIIFIKHETNRKLG